jgi:hypothetical protein
MADGGTAQFAVQTEQRHQVDARQRIGGHIVEVREVGRVEACGFHQAGEELRYRRSPWMAPARRSTCATRTPR